MTMTDLEASSMNDAFIKRDFIPVLSFFINVLPECFQFAPPKTPTFCNRAWLQRHEFQRGVDTDPVSAAANVEEFLARRIGHQKRRFGIFFMAK